MVAIAALAFALALLPPGGTPARGATELCRLHPQDGFHAGCGACGGPGWRRPDGRCARWDEVGVPDCRALRGELRDPRRCAADRQRERGRALPAPVSPSRS